jgi:tetratricopeptide (TPR) repeat protein
MDGKGFSVRVLTMISCSLLPSLRSQTPDATSELRSGIAAYGRGATEEAIKDLERVVSLDPESTDGHFYLALAYHTMCAVSPNCDPHWTRLAIQQYTTVLELNPTHKEALKGMAAVLYRLRRIGEAESLYRKAAKLDASDAEALYAIAVFDWIRTSGALREERLRFNLGQKQPLIGLPTCPEVRAKTMPDVEEGIALLTRTLRLVSYVEPQTYMALLFMERAELQCGDRLAYKRDLKSEQQWWNRACIAWRDGKNISPQRWLLSLPPPPPKRGDTCRWSSRN